MRICSFFASATELLYALGCGEALVGRSERCDYPLDARHKPIVVRSRIASHRLSSRGIHEAVEDLRTRGEHHYQIDVPLLKRLKPDLLLTQELCNVCAAGHPEVVEAIQQLRPPPKTVTISVRRFAGLFDSIRALGIATGQLSQAEALETRLRRQVQEVQQLLQRAKAKTTVWCAEWLDPLLAAGHWIPELVDLAGGVDCLGVVGEDSTPVSWEKVREVDPDIILVMPCSFTMRRTAKELPLLSRRLGWEQLSAVKTKRVFAVENSFYHRPGPRLVEGLKVMAALFHPDLFPRPSPACAQSLLRP